MNKNVYLGARILLGLTFVVFGLNGFLNFIPLPPIEDESAKAFMGGLAATGYFFPFMKAIEVICGLLLLSGFYVPLALAVLAPIIINIVLYHRILAGGPPLDILFLALELILVWGYQAAYKPMLAKKVNPK